MGEKPGFMKRSKDLILPHKIKKLRYLVCWVPMVGVATRFWQIICIVLRKSTRIDSG